MNEDELILFIKYKCTLAAARFRSSQDQSMPEEQRDKDWQIFVDARDYALTETAKLTDEFSKGFCEHQLVKMLTVCGEDDLARKIISGIQMDIAQESAKADFLAGADYCFDSLMGKFDTSETEPEKPAAKPITG